MTKLDDDQIHQLRDQLQAGRKIAAIKLYKDWTGESLVSAKTYVERLAVGRDTTTTTSEDGLEVGQIDLVLDALQKGKKLEAVKLHRESSGLSLKESKEFIERLMEQLEIEDPGSTPRAGCGPAVLLLASVAGIVLIGVMS